jgi:hypothetical protein
MMQESVELDKENYMKRHKWLLLHMVDNHIWLVSFTMCLKILPVKGKS